MAVLAEKQRCSGSRAFIGVIFMAFLAASEICEVGEDDDSALLQSAHPTVQSGLAEVQLYQGNFMFRKHKLTEGTFIGMAFAALIFLIWEFTFNLTKYKPTVQGATGEANTPESPGSAPGNLGDRWWLIIMSAMIEVVSGSVYGMGAWQDDLRDSLNISMTGATVIGAMTFIGNLAGFLGGMIFDKYGPKAAVCLGSCGLCIGYCLIGFALASQVSTSWKLILACLGSLLAGYASVSLLDNIVCMACSVSFPRNRAAVVGYLKAVLATAGGLWALLWVQVFKDRYGLLAFMAISAIASFAVGVLSLSSMKVLPNHCRERVQSQGEYARAFALLFFLTILTCFNVFASYGYASGVAHPTLQNGFVALALQMSPLLVLFTCKESWFTTGENLTKSEGNANVKSGLPFRVAFFGMDFWLLWATQFAIFGAGVATNQNLALILESAGHDSASSLGVALFALTSALSRVVVGILSDKYQGYFTRFHWVTAGAFCAMIGELLVSLMTLKGIMMGTLLMGLSFGSFYTVIVPMVNEMYGNLEFGKMWGAQITSQAAAALIIVCNLMPLVYRKAAAGEELCQGPGCYRPSFILLTMLNALGLISALALQVRNADSVPVTRLVKETKNEES